VIDHERLVRAAAAHDGAETLARAGAEIERVAHRFCEISENTLFRIAAQLRTIAALKRSKPAPTPSSIPGDVTDY
jgi:hypothetical protein